jgi:hypothetical protein
MPKCDAKTTLGIKNVFLPVFGSDSNLKPLSLLVISFPFRE